jgi:hypothetical protein
VRRAAALAWLMAAALALAAPSPLPGAPQGGSAASPPADGGPIPTPADFGARIRAALEADARIQSRYTYHEQRRDVKISRLGKVTIGPRRTFEVHPSAEPGKTFKRLIAIEGKPLTPEELARRDAEHERDAEQEQARRRRESASERAERERNEQEERRRHQEVLDDLIRVFKATVVGRENIDGEPVLVADVKPRKDAEVTTREGRWMKSFEGRIWVDESDYQIVKLDMSAVGDITIGWGIIGRLHEGSGARFSRKKVDGVWLPAELSYKASGRTLLFRPFEFEVTTTYFNYRRRP